ncbi:MAG: ATP-binding protein [Verrucomicrobiota bacterium]
MLTQVKEIQRLSPAEVQRGHQVRLQAVVTCYDTVRDVLYVQDATGGIRVDVSGQEVAAQAGRLVEVEGISVSGPGGPVIGSPTFKELGAGVFPVATPVTRDQWTSGLLDSQWVEINGIVREVRQTSGALMLEIGSAGRGVYRATLFSDSLPADLVDASVWLRGVCRASFNQRGLLVSVRLLVPSLDHLAVETPAPADAPLVSVVKLQQFLKAPVHRVKVQGVVTLQQPGRSFFVQDGTGGVNVQSRQTTRVEPGERVEILGFPVLGQYAPYLQNATFRQLGAGPPPEPVAVTAEQMLEGTYHNHLISTEGQLIKSYKRSGEVVLVLHTGCSIFSARLDEKAAGNLSASLPKDSRLRVTGLGWIQADENRDPRSFRVILRSPADVVILERPPWWTSETVHASLAIMAAVILAAVGWALSLRRCVRTQMALIHRHLKRETVFSELGHKLNGAREWADAARIIANAALKLVGWDACAFYLSGHPKPVISLEASPERGRTVTVSSSSSRFDSFIGEVIEHGAALGWGAEGTALCSLMGVPVRKGDRVLGVLCLHHQRPYSTADRDTMQVLADHCGGALERLRAEEELCLRTEQLQTITDAMLAFLRTGDWNAASALLLRNALAQTASERGFVGVVADGPALRMLAHEGWGATPELRDFDNLLGKAVLTCEVIMADETTPDTRLPHGYPAPRTFLGVPVLKGSEVVGIIGVADRPGGYTSREQANIETLARAVGVLFDGYRRAQREAVLQEQLRQAQKMESVGRLAGGVAHDFNNLLTVIEGHAELLALARLAPADASAVAEIDAAAKRAAKLTQQLLMFSRRQVIKPRPLDMNEVVQNISKMLCRILGEDISVNLNYTGDLPRIEADQGMMEQVILNLAINARDAMPKGGHLTIHTGAATVDQAYARRNPEARPGRFVCLSVTDTGCGIAPEHLPHIFEPFFTTKEVGKGTGLGLATVYGIAKQHHGWVEVASQVNKGTTFRVFLPALAQAAIEVASEPRATVRGGSESILLVEDEPALRGLVRQTLERLGYRVFDASNGQEARNLWTARKAEIQLLVTDLIMPGGLNGSELAEELVADKPDLKVLYMSGYSSDVLGKDYVLEEDTNFLQKPFQPHGLAQAVRGCLDGALNLSNGSGNRN